MSALKSILDLMKQKSNSFNQDYFIPLRWNAAGFKNYSCDIKRPGEINVNPYDYFSYTVENAVKKCEVRSDSPLIYSAIPRSLTAWNHKNDDNIENGTFIKFITLLPLLKKYGVTVIYLLPICSNGETNKKGEFGSPYATRDFYQIDNSLHDPLLGDYSPELLNEEFCAFVEAAHILDIKIIVDFAFRTVSRDNTLISSHPDWFYWIKESAENDFRPPVINGKKAFNANFKNYTLLYENDGLRSYINFFSPAPNKVNENLWQSMVKKGNVSLEDIKKTFNITTAPGFSDVINDTQPAWTDVTYLRYYFDCPKEVKKFINKSDPPFIMQDGASLNVIHGEIQNTELRDYIADVLPFYYKNYGIDGARIDMSHALSDDLNAEIIKRIKSIAPQFLLYSEEFCPDHSHDAKNQGFDLLSGFTYAIYKKACSKGFNKELLVNTMLKTEIPITSAIETPDTPRSMCIFRDSCFVRLIYIINSFLPMSWPLLNSGCELLEIQPMNLGLDNTEEGRFVLPKSDPMYGKLAFFDNYRLHWTNENTILEQTIEDVSKIRNERSELITKRENFVLNNCFIDDKRITVLTYIDKKSGRGLIIAANRSKNSSRVLKEKLFSGITQVTNASIIYDKDGLCAKDINNGETVKISPEEALIISIQCKGE